MADILRTFGTAYRQDHSPSAEQEEVLQQLPICRTEALGAHLLLRCDHCGHQEISYNSCRNRHCPKCQAAARAKWLVERERDLLDAPYFHVVFTLPKELGPIALQDKRLCYGLLFHAAARTLTTIAADPKHLGGEIGFLAVLHTWSQNLLHHPHVHCVVPAGGISPDASRWIPCRKGFFLPVKVLSRLFRRLFLEGLEKAWSKGELGLHGRLEHLRQPQSWIQLMRGLREKEWVVYAKPPFGGSLQVLKYLARYTHRVAISNQRLLAVDNGQVRFLWKDRATDGRSKQMTLDGVEFVRRFLLHVLPRGFMRIRYFGFFANRFRKQKLALLRSLLPSTQRIDSENKRGEKACIQPTVSIRDARRCPACDEGLLVIVALFVDSRFPSTIPIFDSS